MRLKDYICSSLRLIDTGWRSTAIQRLAGKRDSDDCVVATTLALIRIGVSFSQVFAWRKQPLFLIFHQGGPVKTHQSRLADNDRLSAPDSASVTSEAIATVTCPRALERGTRLEGRPGAQLVPGSWELPLPPSADLHEEDARSCCVSRVVRSRPEAC